MTPLTPAQVDELRELLSRDKQRVKRSSQHAEWDVADVVAVIEAWFAKLEPGP